jgi:hypothetical protein
MMLKDFKTWTLVDTFETNSPFLFLWKIHFILQQQKDQRKIHYYIVIALCARNSSSRKIIHNPYLSFIIRLLISQYRKRKNI